MRSLAFVEGGEGVLGAAGAVEQAAFFQQLLRTQAGVAALGRQTVEHGQGRFGVAGAAVQHGAQQQQAWGAWRQALGTVQQVERPGKIPVRLLQPGPAEQRLHNVGRRSGALLVERPRLPHPALQFQAPGQVGDEDRIAGSGEFQHPSVMELACDRLMRLGQHHAEQPVRLRIGRGDSHRIAGVQLRLGERAAAQQAKRQILRGGDVVRIECDDAPDQRLGGDWPAAFP